MNFACPSCNSDNIQRLAVVYESGLSDINTKSRGSAIGIGRGGIGIGLGSSKTRGTTQTAASMRASPPSKKPFLKPLGLFFVLYLIAGIISTNHHFFSILVGLSWIAGSVAWIVYAIRFNSNEWPLLKQNWDNSCLCNRCNAVFQLGVS